MRCELTTGTAAVVEKFPFARTASADGHYSYSYDGIGLHYNQEAEAIEIYSDTRPELGPLYTFATRSYPAAWDNLPVSTDTLAGCAVGADGVLRAGLVWTEGAEEGVNMIVAFFRGQKMVRVQAVNDADWTPGLNVFELDTTGYPSYDRVALFLLSDSAVPLCGAWQSDRTE